MGAASHSRSTRTETVGLILFSANQIPTYISPGGREILCYDEHQTHHAQTEDHLLAIATSLLSACSQSGQLHSFFWSGKRRYACRRLVLERTEGSEAASLAMLLERVSRRNESLRRVLDDLKLTPREREALLLLSEGLTSKEIAVRMNISPHTVQAFLRFIMLKLGVTTRCGILAKVNMVSEAATREL